MGKRPCGCGERGRHKPTCSVKPVSKVQAKESVEDWIDRTLVVELDEAEPSVKDVSAYMSWLYNKHYGKPPELAWSFNKERQATVEQRIRRLVDKKKPFYLTVTKPNNTIAEWYIDGGNWASAKSSDGKYRGIVGHVNTLLPFVIGRSITVWELVSGRVPKRRKRK